MNPATLRAHLAALGFTQTDFARLCGVSTRSVRAWLHGSTRIPVHALLTLGEAVDEAEVLVAATVSAAKRSPGVVPVYRTDEGFRDAFPHLGLYPASFWLVVVGRAQAAAPVGAVRIEFFGEAS